MSVKRTKFHYTFTKTFNIATIYEDDRIICTDMLIEEKTLDKVIDKLNELAEENDQLRLELETHKHPLWSTREAEKKVNKLADSLADEVKKNGLLNEELNQLRIENMRLKKKGGDGV